MLYLSTKKMGLNATEDFLVDFVINSENQYLVGFSDLVYVYSDGKDHHVKEFSLNITSSIIQPNKIRVAVNADMIDNSKNQSKTAKDSYIKISIFAISNDEPLSTEKATSLTSFKVGYGNTDHHLQEYGAEVQPPTSWLQDQHADQRVLGTADGKNILLPKNINAAKLKPSDIKSQAIFLKGFGIKKAKSDCHILKTGVIVSTNHTSFAKQYIFKDNSGEQSLSVSETYADAYALYITNDGKLATFPFDDQKKTDDVNKLNDVPGSFKSISPDGVKENWPGVLDAGSVLSDLWKVSHSQGFASYTDLNLRVFSHSLEGDYGYLIFSNYKTSKFVKIATYDKDFNHPGGIQSIGDYLLVPCEKIKNDNKSRVRLYDMSPLKANLPPQPCDKLPIGERENDSATAAGITKYRDKFGEWFLIVVCNWGICDFYKAKADKPLPECQFVRISRKNMRSIWDPKGRGYDVQCLNLLTQNKVNSQDDREKTYMIAFATKDLNGPLGSYEDHAMLISITPKIEETIRPYEESKYDGIECTSLVEDKHMRTKHSATPDKLGVHFRYGAALEVKNNKLVLYATGRNFTNGNVLCNFFDDIKRLNDAEKDELP